MISQTVMMQRNLPDTFITYLKNAFLKTFLGIQKVEVEINVTHTTVTLFGTDINGICQAIYLLGQENSRFIYEQQKQWDNTYCKCHYSQVYNMNGTNICATCNKPLSA